MPLRLAIPPSTIRASTRTRPDRPHGRAMLTSVVKRGRDLLGPSPISEGGELEETANRIAGPRRLSYSSIALHPVLSGSPCREHMSLLAPCMRCIRCVVQYSVCVLHTQFCIPICPDCDPLQMNQMNNCKILVPLTVQMQHTNTQPNGAGPSSTPPVQECHSQPPSSVHTLSVKDSEAISADFPEAPLSVAALLARMQKLKSTT